MRCVDRACLSVSKGECATVVGTSKDNNFTLLRVGFRCGQRHQRRLSPAVGKSEKIHAREPMVNQLCQFAFGLLACQHAG